MLRFNCPACQKPLKAPEDKAGKTTKCPNCNNTVKVPSPFEQSSLLEFPDLEEALAELNTVESVQQPKNLAPAPVLAQRPKVKWFYAIDNQVHGPVSADDLRRSVKTGTLNPNDLVCKEGANVWTPAKNVKGLSFPASPKNNPAANALPPLPQKPSVFPEMIQSPQPLISQPNPFETKEGEETPVRRLMRLRHRKQIIKWIGLGFVALLVLIVLIQFGTLFLEVVGIEKKTPANFSKVKEGMSLSAVENLVGEGEMESSFKVGETSSELVVWKGRTHVLVAGFNAKKVATLIILKSSEYDMAEDMKEKFKKGRR